MGLGLLLVRLVLSALNVAFVCPDRKAAGRFADIEAADAVFEGVVQRIVEDRSRTCAPDRVVFKVSRVWKGAKQPEIVLLQTAERGEVIVVDGHTALSTCPMWIEQDRLKTHRRYIVSANGQRGHLESLGCGLRGRPTGATRKRLDAWVAEQERKPVVVGAGHGSANLRLPRPRRSLHCHHPHHSQKPPRTTTSANSIRDPQDCGSAMLSAWFRWICTKCTTTTQANNLSAERVPAVEHLSA